LFYLTAIKNIPNSILSQYYTTNIFFCSRLFRKLLDYGT